MQNNVYWPSLSVEPILNYLNLYVGGLVNKMLILSKMLKQFYNPYCYRSLKWSTWTGQSL